MRKMGVFVLAGLLASCGGEATQDGAVDQAMQALDDAALVLDNDGLQLSDEAQTVFDFGAKEAQVRKALDAHLGEPETVFEQPACEPGTLTLVEYSGGLTINMMGGVLVGWVVGLGGDPKYATSEGVGIGTSLEDLEDAHFIVRSGVSPLGAEYSTLGGFGFSVADSGRGQEVQAMDAGEVCFK